MRALPENITRGQSNDRAGEVVADQKLVIIVFVDTRLSSLVGITE